MGQTAVRLGSGDIPFPVVYQQNKSKLLRLLKQGKQDLVELSAWTMADDFMSYVLEWDFLKFADETYPTPRKKTEVPIWFLIACQLVLKINVEPSFKGLKTLLKSGPILSRVGFNVAQQIGFNGKNRYERQTPCHEDTVLKFFRDSNRVEIQSWFLRKLQGWFLKQSAFATEGVFILDQTHLVVPDNEHYEDAVLMPVDEHGQLYKGTTEQIRDYKWHRCYTLSVLLHLQEDRKSFHVTGYHFGPGNTDELPQAQEILRDFVHEHGKGIIKLLIVDRGYVDGKFVTSCKRDYSIDVLLPLKTNMQQHQDAIELSKQDDVKWEDLSDPEQYNNMENNKPYLLKDACIIEDIELWDTCKQKLFTVIIRDEQGCGNGKTSQIKHFVLATTKDFGSAFKVYQHYRVRTRVEECFRQFKNIWLIHGFSSPHPSLLESHIAFVLLTYSLLNFYLRKTGQADRAQQFVSTLKRQRHELDKRIAAYSGNVFGLFGVKEYLQIVASLDEEQRQKFYGANKRLEI